MAYIWIVMITMSVSSIAQADGGDVYNPLNNQLLLPSIVVGDTTYTNVVVTIGRIVSVGGQSTVTTVLTVPFRTAMSNLVKNGFSKQFTVKSADPKTGLSNNNTGTYLVEALQNAPPRTDIPGTLFTANSLELGPMGRIAGTRYYNSDYLLVGEMPEGYSTMTYYSPFPIPLSVKAGDIGSLSTGIIGKVGQYTNIDYSVSADTPNSLLVTISESNTKKSVYRIDKSGNISLVSRTSTWSTGTSIWGSVSINVIYEYL